jgi:hypothetical protein
MDLNLGNTLVEQTFSDGIGSITIIGGTVRIDFMIFSPDEKEADGRPKVAHLQRIVMAPEGFLHSAEKIKEAAQALSKLGTTARPSGGPRLVEPQASSSDSSGGPHVVESHVSAPANEQSASPPPPKRPFP